MAIVIRLFAATRNENVVVKTISWPTPLSKQITIKTTFTLAWVSRIKKKLTLAALIGQPWHWPNLHTWSQADKTPNIARPPTRWWGYFLQQQRRLLTLVLGNAFFAMYLPEILLKQTFLLQKNSPTKLVLVNVVQFY